MIEGNLTELSECTVGLIGFGDIAKATASLLRAFGAKVVYTKKSPAPPDVETRYGVSFLPQEDLLAVSDIVSLHAPVNDETRYMVDASFLEKMKDTAYLINTSRGELEDWIPSTASRSNPIIPFCRLQKKQAENCFSAATSGASPAPPSTADTL